MKSFILSVSCFILLIPFLAYGQDDLYRVKTPYVMIIFDTSNSMNQKPDGTTQGSGNVRVDSTGRVVSAPNGTVYNFEGGGNHPNSKLNQAKLALKEIIDSVVKDRVNSGFSTYAQSISPYKYGLYTRQYRHYYPKTYDSYYWKKRYWGYYSDRHGWNTTVFTKDSFKDQWGTTHVGGPPCWRLVPKLFRSITLQTIGMAIHGTSTIIREMSWCFPTVGPAQQTTIREFAQYR